VRWPSKNPEDYRSGEPDQRASAIPWWTWATPFRVRGPVFAIGILLGASLRGFDDWPNFFLAWWVGLGFLIVADVWWRRRLRRVTPKAE
jgi:hypothetical protein